MQRQRALDRDRRGQGGRRQLFVHLGHHGRAPGTYYIAGYLWNGNGTFTTSHLTQAITITAAPAQTFALSGPTSGTYAAGTAVTIAWTAANVKPGSKISLCYDPDTSLQGHEKWIEIDGVTAANGNCSYTWDTTGVQPGTYYVAGYLWNGGPRSPHRT